MIMSAKGIDGQFGEDMFLKKTGPGAVQELSSFRSQMSPWIENVELFVVFHVKHGTASYLVDIT